MLSHVENIMSHINTQMSSPLFPFVLFQVVILFNISTTKPWHYKQKLLLNFLEWQPQFCGQIRPFFFQNKNFGQLTNNLYLSGSTTSPIKETPYNHKSHGNRATAWSGRERGTREEPEPYLARHGSIDSPIRFTFTAVAGAASKRSPHCRRRCCGWAAEAHRGRQREAEVHEEWRREGRRTRELWQKEAHRNYDGRRPRHPGAAAEGKARPEAKCRW